MTRGGTPQDYYGVLGVSRDADADQLQQAYRRLARANHPDVNRDPAAEERFKEINEAYHVLSDPEQRRRYDRFGPDFRQIPPEYADAAAGAGRGGGNRRGAGDPRVRVGGFGPDDLGGGFADVDLGGDFDGDLGDLFGGLFGGRGRAGPFGGADQEAEIELTVEEAYRGGHRQVTLGGPGGRRTLDVTIPPGVTDGRRIRIAGEGGRGSGGGAAGDLYLVVRIAPHPRYRVEGRNIVVDLPVTPSEAALGARVPVSTPGGDAKVRVPPGTSSGRRLRLRGQGMPDPRGTPGDLHAVVQIMVPPHVTGRERELFEELARVSTFDPRAAR